jgi:hypothetical protein
MISIEYIPRANRTLLTISKDNRGIGSILLEDEDVEDVEDLFKNLIEKWNDRRKERD